MGSISAWLPSRRSTLHHCGAAVSVRDGQVRSGIGIGANGLYLSEGVRCIGLSPGGREVRLAPNGAASPTSRSIHEP